MSQIGYYASVTEYETGCGQRPDGYLIATSRKSFEAKKTEIENLIGHSAFSRVSELKICELHNTGYLALIKSEASSIWTDEPDVYIKEKV